MALYSPAPAYPTLISPPHSESPSPPAAPSPRHATRSERMLIAALRRADEKERALSPPSLIDSTTSTSPEQDYFSRAMDSAWSKSRTHSVNASPSRTYRRLTTHPAPTNEGISRSPSPMTLRGVERDGLRRGRTPSPSPHPYRPNGTLHPPTLSRSQTIPSRDHSSRPSTPSQIPRRSTSPRASYSHSRKESANSVHLSAGGSTLKRTAHEELLRSRLESVLAKQQQQEALMEANGTIITRSRGPSFSRTAPTPAAVAATDYLSGTSQAGPSSPKRSTRRSPSISRANGATPQRTTSSSHISGMVSPSRIKEAVMITPPPSPPHTHASNQPENSSFSVQSSVNNSRAPSQGRHQNQLGLGRPSNTASRASSTAPSSRVTPPPFDARQASIALKQQHGYVSFCEIEGLGEPEGMDADDSDGEGDCEENGEGRGRGRWWEVWRK